MNLRQPRGIRNNNPGNIRHGANWQGLNPNGRNIDSAFCVFESPVFGIRALAKVLINYKKIHPTNSQPLCSAKRKSNCRLYSIRSQTTRSLS